MPCPRAITPVKPAAAPARAVALPAPAPDLVLSKAVVRAAALLGLSQRELAGILGMSEATASRLCADKYRLSPQRAEGVGARAPVRAPVPFARRAVGPRRRRANVARERKPRAGTRARATSWPRWKDWSVSSRTWTPRAVASDAARFAGDAWRAVEAQHIASTMALVDSVAEQHVLEDLLDDGKPPVPARARASRLPALHALPLCAAAGRIALPRRDRSRRVLCGRRGAHGVRRARLLALAASARHARPARHAGASADGVSRAASARRRSTSARRRSSRSARAGPIPTTTARARRSRAWRARPACEAIRYESVRDPGHGGCCAVLDPDAFARRAPLDAADLDAVGVPRACRLAAFARDRRRDVRVRRIGVDRAAAWAPGRTPPLVRAPRAPVPRRTRHRERRRPSSERDARDAMRRGRRDRARARPHRLRGHLARDAGVHRRA